MSTMDLLSSFVPIDRRFALARHQSLPDRVMGAVLFADLSGFTPFSELLDRELGHKLGVEELNRLLDPVWSTLVAEVHSFAGSVIAFSGDAITCLLADRLFLDLGPVLRNGAWVGLSSSGWPL
jgi:class 3 adenylate cyclase